MGDRAGGPLRRRSSGRPVFLERIQAARLKDIPLDSSDGGQDARTRRAIPLRESPLSRAEMPYPAPGPEPGGSAPKAKQDMPPWLLLLLLLIGVGLGIVAGTLAGMSVFP